MDFVSFGCSQISAFLFPIFMLSYYSYWLAGVLFYDKDVGLQHEFSNPL